MNPGTRTVVFFATGGTIAERAATDPKRQMSIHLSAQELLHAADVPASLMNHIRTKDVFDLPSSALSLDDVRTLVQLILADATLAKNRCAIVTVGTNALSEVASFCASILGATSGVGASVIFIAAMRPPFAPDSDALRAVHDVVIEASVIQEPPSVAVHVGGRRFAAWNLVKTSPFTRRAFRSPLRQAQESDRSRQVGFAREWRFAPRLLSGSDLYSPRVVHSALGKPFPKVELITTCIGMSRDSVEAALERKPSALVIEAMGDGQLPPGLSHLLIEAANQGVHVLLTTKCSLPAIAFRSQNLLGAPLSLLSHRRVITTVLPGPVARMILAAELLVQQNN